MILVNLNPEILARKSKLFSRLFNICLVIQYLLYLGYPPKIFGEKFDVMDKMPKSMSENTKNLIRNFLIWAGVYQIKEKTLIANCISSFVFTFYLHWSYFFVDYNNRFQVLSPLLKSFINFIVSYIFEIIIMVILLITIRLNTITSILFFILLTTLLMKTIFYDYSKTKAIAIISYGIFRFRVLNPKGRERNEKKHSL